MARGISWALVVSLSIFAGTASAQTEADRAQARDLGQAGYAAMDAHDYAKAADLFRRADALYHAPTLLLGLARAEAHLGRYVESWEHYRRIVLEGVPKGASAPIREAVESAKQEMTAVENHRAKLTLTVNGPAQPTVSLDGTPLPAAALGVERLVNPGQHAVHVTAPGWKDQDKSFNVSDGGDARVTVQLEPEPSGGAGAQPPPNAGATRAPPGAEPRRSGGAKTLAWVGIAAGGAGIVAGLVTGGLAMSKHGAASGSPCASGPCAPGDLTSYQADRSAYYVMGTASTIAFIAGGALAGAGVVLLVVSPRTENPSAAWVRPFVGPTGAGLTGRF